MDWQILVQPMLMILVPLVISQAKRLVGAQTWLLPIIAPILGAAADVLAHYATGVGVGTIQAMILGMAGVGLREVVDQLKKKVTP